jgi:hypothetical protein
VLKFKVIVTRHFEIVLNPVGEYDCGPYALTSACAICNGQDPSAIRFDAATWIIKQTAKAKIKRCVKKLVPARTEVVVQHMQTAG